MVHTKQKPMYLHGLEGSPKGTKGAWMVQHYGAHAPEMPAKMANPDAFEESYQIAAEAVRSLQPNLIVASSFGGAVLLKLVHEKVWTGPCVFLAQAGIKYGLDARLPAGTHAILIHAEEDKLVPFADSMKIAEASGSQVELWPTGGNHKLHHITTDGTLKRAVEQLLPKD